MMKQLTSKVFDHRTFLAQALMAANELSNAHGLLRYSISTVAKMLHKHGRRYTLN